MWICLLDLIEDWDYNLSSSEAVARDVILEQLGVLSDQSASLFCALAALATSPFNRGAWDDRLVGGKLTNMNVVEIT